VREYCTAAAVPDTFLYVGDLQQDGAPADGNFSVTFQMFNDRLAGTKVFEESVVSLPVVDGVLLHELGTAPSNALDDEELATGELFLSVVVNGTVLEPRVAIRSVPFAARASDSATVAGRAIDDLVEATDLAAGDGLALDGATFAIAPQGITLEHVGSAIAQKQVSGENTGNRLLVIKKPDACGDGIDIIEDTGLGTTLEYTCFKPSCGSTAAGALLYRQGCSVDTTVCTEGQSFVSTTRSKCVSTLRTTVIGLPGELADSDDIVGQLIAVEER
jgi:hypothetical protein